MKRLTDKGLFSKSLYELVIGTVVRVPPLRERVEDVEVIANHILTEMAARHSMPTKTLSHEAMELLNSCHWPGNIKQLQGVIEQAFFHTAGSVIDASHIKLPGEHRIENPGSMIRMPLLQAGNRPVATSANWPLCSESAA